LIFKRLTVVASAITIGAQVCAAPLAMAGEVGKSPRVMLYASLPFGERNQKQTAPRLGLRFERSAPSNSYSPLRSQSIQDFRPLAEFRLTSGYGYSLRFVDSPLYDSVLGFGGESSSESSIENSLGGSLQNPVARAALIFLLGAAVLCVAETVICEEDDDGYQQPADTGPGTGG